MAVEGYPLTNVRAMSRVLFVCGGNTCRSPMAGALAEHMVHGLEAETAGVTPGTGLESNATTVIRERTGVSVGDHEPVALADTDPGSYDAVVAMDAHVADEVMRWLPPTLPMYVWDVADPFRGSLDEYRRSANTIASLIRATFGTELTGIRRRESRHGDPLSQLDADLSRWRTQVSQVAPTHCNGIAATASRRLERLLKTLLGDRIARSEATVDEILAAIHYSGTVADVPRLPLGVVVNALAWSAKRDEELKIAWQAGTGDALQGFVTARNTEIHDAEPTAIIAGTTRLLDLVATAVSITEFRILLTAAIVSTET